MRYRITDYDRGSLDEAQLAVDKLASELFSVRDSREIGGRLLTDMLDMAEEAYCRLIDLQKRIIKEREKGINQWRKE